MEKYIFGFNKLGIIGYIMLAVFGFMLGRLIYSFFRIYAKNDLREKDSVLWRIVFLIVLLIFFAIYCDLVYTHRFYEFETEEGVTLTGKTCYITRNGSAYCEADDGTVYMNIKKFKKKEIKGDAYE